MTSVTFRGHEGAGDFGCDTTLYTVEATVTKAVTKSKVALSGAGPEARSLTIIKLLVDLSVSSRGWSSAATWGEERLVMVGGLAGDDTSPRR